MSSDTTFGGYHSEWNLGSPGGWDYQRVTQLVGKATWERLNEIRPTGVDLDFGHPLLNPLDGFVRILVEAHRSRAGSNPGLIAVVAEEETLEDVSENRNLAKGLGAIDGLQAGLMAPQHLELRGGDVCWKGEPVSVAFVDFNTDVLLRLHREHDLSPLLRLVREGRVLNPRGTEPINLKSIFELLSSPGRERFHPEIARRTPWTRRFFERRTEGPAGEEIDDLVAWTAEQWDRLVLKPARGYSGHGVRVGTVHGDGDEAVKLALETGDYIVQERIPLHLWAEEVPELDEEARTVSIARVQTDFRCFLGPDGVVGFLGRFGGVPTNVGSGGGVQPLALLRSELTVAEASRRINDAIAGIDYDDLHDVLVAQRALAVEHELTYLLGPIRMALRPRLVTEAQLGALCDYGEALWSECVKLESMWLAGELDEVVDIEEEELEIARSQPWKGAPALIASDGLFDFGAHPEEESP